MSKLRPSAVAPQLSGTRNWFQERQFLHGLVRDASEIQVHYFIGHFISARASPVAQGVKKSAYKTRDPGLIPGSGRSPGEWNGNPLPYCCLRNPMDSAAWMTTVHGVAESDGTN